MWNTIQSNGRTIPILAIGQPFTPEYARALDIAIASDGCTGVPDLRRDCCVVHDLGWRHGIDPWGRPVTPSQANTNFRTCNQEKSKLGKFSPLAWWRWAGVTIFGRLTGRV